MLCRCRRLGGLRSLEARTLEHVNGVAGSLLRQTVERHGAVESPACFRVAFPREGRLARSNDGLGLCPLGGRMRWRVNGHRAAATLGESAAPLLGPISL